MTGSEWVRFSEGLADLFAAWGKVPDEAQARGYWRLLEDLPLGDVLDGLVAAGRAATRWAPSAGQIREAIALGPGTRQHGTGRVECEACQGVGWAQETVLIQPGQAWGPYAPTDREWSVSRVSPCQCPNGARKQRGRGAAA